MRSLRVAFGVDLVAIKEYLAQDLKLPLDTIGFDRSAGAVSDLLDRFLARQKISRLSLRFWYGLDAPVVDLARRLRAASTTLQELEIHTRAQPSAHLTKLDDLPSGLRVHINTGPTSVFRRA
jgi:hypothetical protein